MAVRKGLTKRVELPHEEGEYVEVRLLGYHDLNTAKEVKTFSQIRIFKELGPQPQVQAPTPPPDVVPPVEVDPLTAYDLDTLLTLAIVGWSYPEPVTPDAIRSLDEVTADYVGRQIVLKPESHDDQKNG